MHRVWRLRLAAIVLVLLAAAWVSPGVPAAGTAQSIGPATAKARVGWWVGGVAPDCPQGGCPHVYSEDLWQALRETDAFLSVGLTYTEDFGPGATRTDLPDLVRRALAERVEVVAWMLVPASHGTFANENNAGLMQEAVQAFDAWKREQGLKITEVVLDLELPAGYQPLVDAQDPGEFLAQYGPIDPAHQCEAIRTYQRTIAWADAHGLRLTGSPMPFLLDDLQNGDQALADVLDAAPMLTGYDDMYVQAYRTYSNTGSDYVAQYFHLARQLFGRAGEVTLGDTTMSTPYDRVGPLVEDVRLLAGLGAARVPVFNLEGSLSKYGVSGIRQVGLAARHPMTSLEIAVATAPDSSTAATRGFFRTLDTLATPTSPAPNPYPSSC